MNKKHLIGFIFILSTIAGESLAIFSDGFEDAPPIALQLTLHSSRSSCVAPCGITFHADASGIEAPFHQLQYEWNFGDPGSYFQQRVNSNANQSSGILAAHVYQQPGDYIVTLNATGANSISGNETTTISVLDPETMFAGATWCVSNTNNFTACPTSNSQFHLTSYAQANALITSLRFANPQAVRVLFHSDEIFDVNGTTTIRDIHNHLLIGRYDTGALPVLRSNSAVMANSGRFFYVIDSDQLTFTELQFESDYDPVTGTGSHPTGLFLYLNVAHITIFRNVFDRMGLPLYPHGGTRNSTALFPSHHLIADNHISNWQDYGIFGDFGQYSALLGNRIEQHVDAISGSEGKCHDCVPNFPDHGPIRVPKANHLLIQNNQMFNNAGWSSGGLAHQPCIRLGTTGQAFASVVSDNELEGGFAVISMVTANPGPDSAAIRGDVIFERNTLTATNNSGTLIDIELGGSIVRNNLFLKPDNGGPPLGTGTLASAIRYFTTNTTPENLTHDNKVYNNTLISLSANAAPALSFIDVENDFSRFEIVNNLLYLPLIGNGSVKPSGSGGGLLRWDHSAPFSHLLSDNNLLYAPNLNHYSWLNGLGFDLPAWQQQGFGSSSLLTDPLLQNANVLQAALSTLSPAINAGLPIPGLLDDHSKLPRDHAPDIGAAESQ